MVVVGAAFPLSERRAGGTVGVESTVKSYEICRTLKLYWIV